MTKKANPLIFWNSFKGGKPHWSSGLQKCNFGVTLKSLWSVYGVQTKLYGVSNFLWSVLWSVSNSLWSAHRTLWRVTKNLWSVTNLYGM